MRRQTLIEFVGRMPASIIAMEACCGAHYLGRFFAAREYEVRFGLLRASIRFRQAIATGNDVQALILNLQEQLALACQREGTGRKHSENPPGFGRTGHVSSAPLERFNGQLDHGEVKPYATVPAVCEILLFGEVSRRPKQ